MDAAPRHHFLPALTGVRAVAAGWVVAYHLLPTVKALLPGTYAAFHAVAALGYLGVDIFFILSGFVLALNYAERLRQPTLQRVGQFLWARLARIYPVHLFTLLLLVPASLLLSHLHAAVEPGRFSARGFVANLFLVQAWRLDTIPHLNWNTPSWSVSCEWLAYLLFPLLLLTVYRLGAGRVPVTWALPGAVAGLLAAVPLLIWVTGEAWHFGLLDHSVRILGEFTAGMLLYRCFAAGLGARRNWTMIGGACVLLLIALGQLLILTGQENMAYVLVPLFAPLLYALAQGQQQERAGRAAGLAALLAGRGPVFWGSVSYSLYMTHNLWLMAAKAVLPPEHFAGGGLAVHLAVLAGYLLPLPALAALTYLVVEEPSRRFLNRLAAPRRVRAIA